MNTVMPAGLIFQFVVVAAALISPSPAVLAFVVAPLGVLI